MVKSGLWPALAKRFKAETGYRAELAVSGNREVLAEAFQAGKLDLVAIHGGDAASNLVSRGYGRNMRPWTRNEFVVIGPRSDPAGIRGLRDGSVALGRIAKAHAPFVDYQNSGPREITSALWKKAGIVPSGDWLVKDDSASSEEVIESARKKQAYLVLGRVPTVPGDMEVLVQGDPEMHRTFVVIEAHPTRFPGSSVNGARRLVDFLLKPETQKFLLAFATNSAPGLPMFLPVKHP